MSILNINNLALELVARDFSDGHAPDNAGPTKTSRALAIIHLAAHDAYAKVTEKLKPRLKSLPQPPNELSKDDVTGTAALLAAGIQAARQLYPTLGDVIDTEIKKFPVNNNPIAINYGNIVADAWLKSRENDLSCLPQLDRFYNNEPGRHRPDPLDSGQATLGRNWGRVHPFVLSNVESDAFLEKQPDLTSQDYAAALEQVAECGKNTITEGDRELRDKAVIGIFWG
jgi:hypothetical protein